jgi:hypothetical protein
MKRFILTLFFVTLAVAAFCQVDDGGLKDALINIGINPSWALVASILFTTIVLQVIPQKWAGVTHLLRNIFYGIYLFLKKVDEKLNNVSKSQKLKKAAGVVILLLAVSAINAQSFSGFLKPSDQVVKSIVLRDDGQEVIKPILLFRPYVAMTAQAYNLKDKTVGFLNGAGFGLSYGKYTPVNDKAWCNWSVNATLLTQVSIGDVMEAKVGPAVSLGLLDNLFSAGVGYVDKKVLLLFGVGYTF